MISSETISLARDCRLGFMRGFDTGEVFAICFENTAIKAKAITCSFVTAEFERENAC